MMKFPKLYEGDEMKKVEEKAAELLQHILENCPSVEESLKAIVLALKEQDRDTRHACAEAVIGISCEAHDLCMNVKAV